jgi:hypothetical protein
MVELLLRLAEELVSVKVGEAVSNVRDKVFDARFHGS